MAEDGRARGGSMYTVSKGPSKIVARTRRGECRCGNEVLRNVDLGRRGLSLCRRWYIGLGGARLGVIRGLDVNLGFYGHH